MYFAQEEKSAGYVRLAIFGEKRGRRGAQLKVFSSMEHKRPNCVLKDGKELREPLDIKSSSQERSSSKDDGELTQCYWQKKIFPMQLAARGRQGESLRLRQDASLNTWDVSRFFVVQVTRGYEHGNTYTTSSCSERISMSKSMTCTREPT